MLCQHFLEFCNSCQIHNFILLYQKFIELNKLIFLFLTQFYSQLFTSVFQCRQIIWHGIFLLFYTYF